MILVTTEQKFYVKTLGADQLSGLPQVIRIWEQWYHVYIKRNSTQALTRGLSNVSFLNYFNAYLKKQKSMSRKLQVVILIYMLLITSLNFKCYFWYFQTVYKIVE